MRIKHSSYITSLRGVLGGTVAVNRSSGNFLNKKKSSLSVSSSSQKIIQSNFATLTRQWHSLTSQQRSTWQDLIGHTQNSFQRFIALNMFCLRVGIATSNVKPQRPQFSITPSIAGSFNTNSQTVSLLVGTYSGTSQFRIRIDVSIPVQLSFSSYKRNFFYAGLFPCSTGSAIDISSFIISTFGTIHPGTKYFIRYTLVDTLTGYHSQNFFTTIFESIDMAQLYWLPILVPPIAANFLWVNQGTATITNTNGALFLKAPALAGDSCRLQIRAVGSNTSVTIGLLPSMIYTNYNNLVFGFYNSNNGRMVTIYFSPRGASTPYIAVARWNSPTSWASDLKYYNIPFGNNMLFFQASFSGNTLTFSWSSDGQNFHPDTTDTISLFLGNVTHFCWGVSSGQASEDAGALCFHWKES